MKSLATPSSAALAFCFLKILLAPECRRKQIFCLRTFYLALPGLVEGLHDIVDIALLLRMVEETAQKPGLADYADGVDTMAFLSGLS